MVQRTDSVEGAAAAPDLLHLARQRHRVGRVIPAGQERNARARAGLREESNRAADRARIYRCYPDMTACASRRDGRMDETNGIIAATSSDRKCIVEQRASLASPRWRLAAIDRVLCISAGNNYGARETYHLPDNERRWRIAKQTPLRLIHLT